MATISLTIPDDQLERVIDALCARPFIVAQPSTETIVPSEEAAKQVLVNWVQANVVAYEMQQARDAVQPPDTKGLVT